MSRRTGMRHPAVIEEKSFLFDLLLKKHFATLTNLDGAECLVAFCLVQVKRRNNWVLEASSMISLRLLSYTG